MGCVLLFEDLIRVWPLLRWTLPCWMGRRQHSYLWSQLTLQYWTNQDIRYLLMPREKFAFGAWIQTGRAVAPRSTSTSSRQSQSRLLISAGFAQCFPASMTSFTPALKESHQAVPCVLPTAHPFPGGEAVLAAHVIAGGSTKRRNCRGRSRVHPLKCWLSLGPSCWNWWFSVI